MVSRWGRLIRGQGRTTHSFESSRNTSPVNPASREWQVLRKQSDKTFPTPLESASVMLQTTTGDTSEISGPMWGRHGGKRSLFQVDALIPRR